jgi:hypothetical protein
LSPARGVKLDMEYLDRLLWFGIYAGLMVPLTECAARIERDVRRRLKPMKITVIHGQG